MAPTYPGGSGRQALNPSKRPMAPRPSTFPRRTLPRAPNRYPMPKPGRIPFKPYTPPRKPFGKLPPFKIPIPGGGFPMEIPWAGPLGWILPAALPFLWQWVPPQVPRPGGFNLDPAITAGYTLVCGDTGIPVDAWALQPWSTPGRWCGVAGQVNDGPPAELVLGQYNNIFWLGVGSAFFPPDPYPHRFTITQEWYRPGGYIPPVPIEYTPPQEYAPPKWAPLSDPFPGSPWNPFDPETTPIARPSPDPVAPPVFNAPPGRRGIHGEAGNGPVLKPPFYDTVPEPLPVTQPVAQPPHANVPPENGTKERKVRVPMSTFRRIVGGAWGTWTELGDATKAIYGGLDKKKKIEAWKQNGYRPLSQLQQMRYLWENLDHVDWNVAVGNLIVNEAGDRAVGFFGSRIKKAIRGNPYWVSPVGPQYGGRFTRAPYVKV